MSQSATTFTTPNRVSCGSSSYITVVLAVGAPNYHSSMYLGLFSTDTPEHHGSYGSWLSTSWPWLLVFAATIALVLGYLHSTRSGIPLPPSPPKHWIWGNKDWLNRPYRHIAFGTECKQYLGDIISFTAPFETSVVLNTMELATELLEKQAAVTSDRPRNTLVHDIMGWSTAVAFQPHDERHKRLRRVIASALHPSAARSYATQHHDSALDLIRRIAASPVDFAKHTNDVTGAFIMRLTYGHVVTPNDPLLESVHHSMAYLGEGISRFHWVNHISILKHIPAWFPGAGFQVLGGKGRRYRDHSLNEPFNNVFEQVRRGHVEQPSYTSRLLESKGGTSITEEDLNLVKWTAGSMFSAGSSTTVGVVLSFYLMMALHPETAKIAQAEIDSVVGRARIPELSDREALPFLEAVLQEVMRLCTVAPLGVAHLATKDLDFRGYRIPKGASIHSNIWAMLRDPKHYLSPNTFDPTRFLKANPDPDPRKYIFGFGRRVCPGLHVANNSTWVMCTGVLSVFDIRASPELAAKVDALGGRESERLYELFAPSGIFDPLPFSASFIPRDAAAAAMIEIIDG